MNKTELKKIKAEMTENNDTTGESVFSGTENAIGKSIDTKLSKKFFDIQSTVNEEIKQITDKGLSKIRQDVSQQILNLVGTITSIREDISSKEISLKKVGELEITIKEFKKEFNNILDSVKGEHKNYSVSLVSLGDRLNDISGSIQKNILSQFDEVKKSLSTFDRNIKSLHDKHAVYLQKFQIIDKNFLQLEKDLKKYASNIYEYGSQLSVLGNGALIGMSGSINFKNGTNTTVSVTANKQGGIDVVINSSVTALQPTETPNGSIKVFTFSTASAQPSYLVIDGLWVKATSKSGTINWTWNNGTMKATLTIPAQDDIWAVV